MSAMAKKVAAVITMRTNSPNRRRDAPQTWVSLKRENALPGLSLR